MPSFKYRSNCSEFLDADHIPFEDIKKNMEELNFINTYLGGHKITIDGVAALLRLNKINNRNLNIVEIGCGGGDNLRAIGDWAKRKNVGVKMAGIDINKECIAYARSLEKNIGIEFIHSDYKGFDFATKPHIIFSSLFCHHFTDPQLIEMVHWMNRNAQLGFFINDLHRHPVAYYSIKGLTSAFSKSYLVKNDAPLSVLRGFKRDEWIHILSAAGIRNFSCHWKWAFRWLIISPSHANT
ncbi:MAG TPA: methyltransferase domain-containing protein [Flavisolibacter sp.]|nr:methyltransferase domain-containing protein [Flavisolibacter sp.]